MIRLRNIALIALYSIIAVCSHAQNRVSGVVLDFETKAPVPYASIGVVDGFNGTATNDFGQFTFVLPQDEEAALKVSSIGYETFVIDDIHKALDTIWLKPSVMILNGVTIMSSDFDAKRIVRKAFASIKKNYILNPFIMKGFYRHYCKDDSLYGRLIEAAVDIYKPKGYRRPEGERETKDQSRLVQLRRSLDHTGLKGKHRPFALDLCLVADVAGYYNTQRSLSDYMFRSESENILRKNLMDFKFEFQELTSYDGHEVYVIAYEYKEEHSARDSAEYESYDHSGRLFVNTDDYAIVKSENRYKAFNNTSEDITYYKRYNDRYALFRSIHETKSVTREGVPHVAHIELLINDLAIGREHKFKSEAITARSMSRIEYDSTFWKEFNIIRQDPLEEKIVAQLESRGSLKEQYIEMYEKEKYERRETVLAERSFERVLTLEKDKIIFVDFWASWCGPCIAQFIRSKKVVKEYSEKGVVFVYLSIDNAEAKERWQKIKQRPYLSSKLHYRIGPDSQLLNTHEVSSIPRYMIYYNGELIDDNAPPPSHPEFRKRMDHYLVNGVVVQSN